MSINAQNIVGSLIVAGVVSLVAIAWRISIQMETFQGQITTLQQEILRNRTVSCRLAKDQNLWVPDCP